jgi:hypothetical protein
MLDLYFIGLHGSQSQGIARPLDGVDVVPIWWVVINILNKESQIADMGWSTGFGIGRGAYKYSRQDISLLQNDAKGLGLGWILEFKETGCKSVDWIQLDQDWALWWVLENTIMNFRAPYKAGNLWTIDYKVLKEDCDP